MTVTQYMIVRSEDLNCHNVFKSVVHALVGRDTHTPRLIGGVGLRAKGL